MNARSDSSTRALDEDGVLKARLEAVAGLSWVFCAPPPQQTASGRLVDGREEATAGLDTWRVASDARLMYDIRRKTGWFGGANQRGQGIG